MSSKLYDFAVVGGGIVGLATALELTRRGASVALLEAEERPGEHQTGHNSGVIHSGLYYRPGTLRARLCVSGRPALLRFCERHGIPFENCGKLILATDAAEQERLAELERRGRDNGLAGLQRLGASELRLHEPHAGGLAGLWVPQTAIVDFSSVATTLFRLLGEAGAERLPGHPLRGVVHEAEAIRLLTPSISLRARVLIACAGLQADRVARRCGVDPGARIVPFRGEYMRLRPGREQLVRHLIYPVPHPSLPFLGVHFTRRLGGEVEVGPNAVLALHRHGYRRGMFSARDLLACLSYPGFWRLLRRHRRAGWGEFRRSRSRSAYVAALRQLVPDVQPGDLLPHRAGVRAQAVAPDGRLIDDFHIVEGPRMLHVINAPSPAATACLTIAGELADRLLGPGSRRVSRSS